MTIETNMVVTLNYKLSNHKTGEHIEETTQDNPMVFLYGVGAIIPDFEQNIQGKKVGESFEFAIIADNAYGNYIAEQVVKIPANVFVDESGKFDDQHVKVGAILPMSDNEGNQMRGRVVEITPEYVEMDFNHPLAGTDLKFEGQIVDIRPATQEELDHGHVHGPGGHHH